MFQKKIFSERVASLRKERGLSQEAFGQAVKTTKATVSRLESGDRAPSLDMLCAIANYFDVSLDYLVGRSEERKRR